MRKASRWVRHLFMALGMLAVTLIVLYFVLGFAGQLPIVGGPAAWVGQHASGAAEGF